MSDIKKTKLDVEKISQNAKKLSTEDALKDVIPMEWSEDVLEGKRKVVLGTK